MWQQAKNTVSQRDAEIIELKAELASVKQEREGDRLKAAAMSQINTAGVINSQQMYMLLQSALRTDDEGSPVVLNGGVEQPLSDYLAHLKQSAEWQTTLVHLAVRAWAALVKRVLPQVAKTRIATGI